MLKLILFILHFYYKHYEGTLFYVRGVGKDYPKYLLYTEDEQQWHRMDDL